jgi:hypothetical protein
MPPIADDRPNESPNTESPSGTPSGATLDVPVKDDGASNAHLSETRPNATLTLPMAEGDRAPDTAPAGDQKRRRRRRRRRHKGPRPPGAEGSAAGIVAPTAPGAETLAPNGALPAAPSGDAPSVVTPGTAPTGDQPHKRRRRRRRRGPRPPGADAAVASGANQTGAPGEAAQPATGVAPDHNAPGRSPDDRGPGNRGPGGGPRPWRSRDKQQRQGGRGAPDRPAQPDRAAADKGARARGAPNSDSRDRGGQNRDNRDRGPRRSDKKPFGRGRDASREKPQPKLYSFESVVDRGFEDVADEANQGATRRIDWTIVKRTVADQRSAKAVSAVYVLKRDGVLTDFVNLAAARAAVNKTIVHPEKLTRAKADYGSTKK